MQVRCKRRWGVQADMGLPDHMLPMGELAWGAPAPSISTALAAASSALLLNSVCSHSSLDDKNQCLCYIYISPSPSGLLGWSS